MNIWATDYVSISRSEDVTLPFLQRNISIFTPGSGKLQESLEAMITTSTGEKQFILEQLSNVVKGKITLTEKKKEETQEAKTRDTGNGIHISNAGLIIAWPFIATLFNKIGLLDKNKFIDETSQQKAVLLTQYLTNFSTEFEESDLALNKLLCGMEIHDFVDVTVQLSDYDKETASFLLGAIINNWDKLNKTSVKTLQETFLQREGVLQRHEKDHKLQVESKAYDLLLKTIPWNIGMIQTSFMKNRILVTWKY
jgi:hypothetical protein